MSGPVRTVTALKRWSCSDTNLPPVDAIRAVHVYDFDNTRKLGSAALAYMSMHSTGQSIRHITNTASQSSHRLYPTNRSGPLPPSATYKRKTSYTMAAGGTILPFCPRLARVLKLKSRALGRAAGTSRLLSLSD